MSSSRDKAVFLSKKDCVVVLNTCTTGKAQTPLQPHPPSFPGAKKKCFFVKLENITFLHVNNMIDFSLFIEQDISDKI